MEIDMLLPSVGDVDTLLDRTQLTAARGLLEERMSLYRGGEGGVGIGSLSREDEDAARTKSAVGSKIVTIIQRYVE